MNYVDTALLELSLQCQVLAGNISGLQQQINNINERLQALEQILNQKNSALGMFGSVVAPIAMLNPMLGVCVTVISSTLTALEMLEHGLTPDNVGYMLNNFISALISIKTKTSTPVIPSTNPKLDYKKIIADDNIKYAKTEKAKSYQMSNGRKFELDASFHQPSVVQKIYVPLEAKILENKNKWIRNLAHDSIHGTANPIKRTLYKFLDKNNAYPMHQYTMVHSNEIDANGKAVRIIRVYGVSDGSAVQTDNPALIGNNSFGSIPINADMGVGYGPGILKMKYCRTRTVYQIL